MCMWDGKRQDALGSKCKKRTYAKDHVTSDVHPRGCSVGIFCSNIFLKTFGNQILKGVDLNCRI